MSDLKKAIEITSSVWKDTEGAERLRNRQQAMFNAGIPGVIEPPPADTQRFKSCFMTDEQMDRALENMKERGFSNPQVGFYISKPLPYRRLTFDELQATVRGFFEDESFVEQMSRELYEANKKRFESLNYNVRADEALKSYYGPRVCGYCGHQKEPHKPCNRYSCPENQKKRGE